MYHARWLVNDGYRGERPCWLTTRGPVRWIGNSFRSDRDIAVIRLAGGARRKRVTIAGGAPQL